MNLLVPMTGYIYRLSDEEDKSYYTSSFQSKSDYIRYINLKAARECNLPIYSAMREGKSFVIQVIEEYECESKQALHARCCEYVRELQPFYNLYKEARVHINHKKNPDYKNGKIYRIYDSTGAFYIGSTTLELAGKLWAIFSAV